jgi:hypothetical protein
VASFRYAESPPKTLGRKTSRGSAKLATRTPNSRSPLTFFPSAARVPPPPSLNLLLVLPAAVPRCRAALLLIRPAFTLEGV